MRQLPWIVALAALAECGQRPTTAAPSASQSRMVAMSHLDSATIEQLCQQPDSVRAGRKDCVLKDQSYRQTRTPLPKPPQ